jgi:NAD(P)-dependent dehydrogenase (short-subunit alcohol dehydrogenase family)
MDVDFGGVMNAVAVVLPYLEKGASIVLTGSTAGMMPGTLNNPALGPGGVGYGLAKTFIVQYTEVLALQLAPLSIRVNAVHPTNCNTNLLHNNELYKIFRPDVENPTRDDVCLRSTSSRRADPVVEPRYFQRDPVLRLRGGLTSPGSTCAPTPLTDQVAERTEG